MENNTENQIENQIENQNEIEDNNNILPFKKVEIVNDNEGKNSFINLPNIPDNMLPTCTIVTPTYNRSLLFDIAIRNFKNTNYPKYKLFWIILDDSDEKEKQEYEKMIKYEFSNDSAIKYVHHPEKLTIGAKRNKLAEMCQTDIICHMDDDDYYYPDSVRIRVISILYHKVPVSGCIEYNCYNLVDDSQFIARGTPDKMNVGEAALCYSRSFWNQNKFNDEDKIEEAIFFLRNVNKTDKDGNAFSLYIDIPCMWILISITHGKNTSGRKAIAPVLNYSFLELLPLEDNNYIKKMKYKLMMNDPENKKAMDIVKEMQKQYNNQQIHKIDKMVDSLKPKMRKNVFIREFLHNVPSKNTHTDNDFLILCFPGQHYRKLNFEEETELVEFVQKNKNKYRFTIYTDCESGKTLNGISVSPFWKWRSANKYNYCLVYAEPSHFNISINVPKENVYFFNKLNFGTPDVEDVINIQNFEELNKKL